MHSPCMLVVANSTTCRSGGNLVGLGALRTDGRLVFGKMTIAWPLWLKTQQKRKSKESQLPQAMIKMVSVEMFGNQYVRQTRPGTTFREIQSSI